MSKNGYVWATQWPTSSELKIKFDPSLDRSWCEFFKIIKNHGPKNPPLGCNLGPKFPASCCTLLRNFWQHNCPVVKLVHALSHWSISVKKWQKLFQVKMAPNFTKFEWYQQWKASQGLKNWLKAIKAIKATVQARYEKKINFHNFFDWLWFFRPKNSCGALGLTKKVHKGQKGHYKARS